jgi:hypothetical protein
MINFTAEVAVSVSDRKMKKKMSGPRVETLMIIRHFARTYEFEPERKRMRGKSLVN